MADSSEPAFLFLYRKEAVAPVDYLSTFATAPFRYQNGLSMVMPLSVGYPGFAFYTTFFCRPNGPFSFYM